MLAGCEQFAHRAPFPATTTGRHLTAALIQATIRALPPIKPSPPFRLGQ